MKVIEKIKTQIFSLRGKKKFFIFNILTVLITGFMLRLILYKFGTYQLDFNTFVAWSNSLKEVGFAKFYGSNWSDYLPGYLYVLALLANIRTLFPVDLLLLYKLPAIVADLITGYLIYLIVKKKNEKWALVASAFYIFNPAIIINSTLWGQVDSVTSLCAVLALFLLDSNIYLSSTFLAIGTLIKPQVAFIAPLILVLMLKNKVKTSKIFMYIFLGAVIFTIGFLPFKDNQNLISFMMSRISVSLNQYPFSSVNAFNFWGLGGFWRRDDVGFFNAKLVGWLVSIFLSGLLLFKFYVSKKSDDLDKYKLAAGIFLITFLFMTRIHERHLLPFFAVAAISLIDDVSAALIYLGFSLTYVFNLIYAYSYISADHSLVISQGSTQMLIVVNLLLFLLFWAWYFKKLEFVEKFFERITKLGSPNVEKFEGKIRKKTVLILLGAILTFTFLTRLINLGVPKNEYFDEVYHAFTARQILHGNPKAWEWWNPNPTGFAYEWTHPPLAKLGMVEGMILFGENSFGWRFPGIVLGTGCTFLVFLIARKLFEDDGLGLIAAAVFSLDGLNVVLSRTGMNDIYMLFFALLALYLFLKDKNFLASLAFGASIASKWSAVWLLPILFIAHFVFNKKIRLSYLWFLIVPITVYVGSYVVFFATGHTFSQFIEVQRQMWWYHTNLKATHPYSSLWWSWPLDLRPVYFYTSDEINGWVARIYVFGNPLISWFGILVSLFTTYVAFFKRNKRVFFVLFSYLVFFVPWAVSPRIMFYYHYLPSTPFLAILIAWFLRTNKKLIAPVLIVFLVSFLYFYPHFVALQVPLWLDHSYYWLSSWR